MASSNTNDSISTIDKNIIVKPAIKFYPDLFDILDHDDENETHMNEEQKWTKIKEEFKLAYNFDNTLSNIDEDEPLSQENESINDNDEILEEQVLSQRLSQLSTTSSYECEPSIDGKRRRQLQLTIAKRFRPNTDDTNKKDSIPEYLLSKNELFDQTIGNVMDNVSSSEMDQIRQMTFFIHKISGFTILRDLWSAYLRSGTGQLNVDQTDDNEEENVVMPIDRRYWPNHVKSVHQSRKKPLSTDVTKENENIVYETFVYEQLHEYGEEINHYQKQFDQMKCNLSYWTTTLEDTIQTYVYQHGIASLRLKCDSKTAMLTYDYQDEILRRKYQQHKPTDYQKKIAEHLYDLELQLETTKNELIEYRQRVICNKPPTCFDSLQISLPSSINTISDRNLRQQLLNRYQQLIQKTKTDLMAVNIVGKQAIIDQYQTIFNEKTNSMWQNNHKHIQNKDMTRPLLKLMSKRSINMTKKVKEMCNFTINYHIRGSYDQFETIKRIGFISNLIVDPVISTKCHLTDQQLKLLNRGPTYVAPGQLHVLSSFQTIDDMIWKQYTPLKHQLAIIFQEYHIDISRSSNFDKHAYNVFKDLYSSPLPDDIYQRAVYESKVIQAIRHSLKKTNLILRRTADQNNIFYLGSRTDFTNVSNQYMANTDNYNVLIDMNEISQQDVQQLLHEKFLSMNLKLEKLFEQKRFNRQIHKKLRVKIEHLKLPYLYFLPDVSQTNSLQVKPMISAHRSATFQLARYLKQLLRPFVCRHMSRTTFIDESDLIEKLNSYTDKEHHLHPTTLFATIKITNFNAMDSHKPMFTMLVNFLTDNLATNILHYTSIKTMNNTQTISIDTIKQLTELYLSNNIFYYNGKIYEFEKGGPNSLLFSEILSTVYLHAYDKRLFSDPRLKTELFGRCKDQLFFTWNRSKEELSVFLDTFVERHRHIHMETSIGRCVHFLNAHIENRNGHLYTCVYHDSTKPKYTLPYVVGHDKSKHSLWFRSALMRAVRFCSNFMDFIQEQIHLEMACLTNGYSIDFIETQLRHFYIRFSAEKIRFCLDQTVYERLRRRLFDFVTVQRSLSAKDQELEDTGYTFNFSYSYDYGPYYQFNEQFHQIWTTYLKEDPQLSHKDTKVILNAKHSYSLNTLLAEEKLCDELLNISKKTTC